MTTSHRSGPRPYKVWSCDRQTRKAVVASTLNELKEKGCKKLDYNVQLLQEGKLRLVLENDGTEVEDEQYFQTVPHDTIFLLIRHPLEKWLPPGVEALRAVEGDTVDTGLTEISSLPSILDSLRRDIANLIILDEEKLQLVANMKVQEHQKSLKDRQLLAVIQEAADRILIDRQSFREARDLLALVKSHLHPENTGDVAGTENKHGDQLDSATDSDRPQNSQVLAKLQELRHELGQRGSSNKVNDPPQSRTSRSRSRKRGKFS